jgi:hypothetical protein
VLLPQLLFSGFFVRVEDLPGWIQWIQWINPVSYAFRLLLAEEFSSCLEFTDKERYVINCAKALQNSLDDVGASSLDLLAPEAVQNIYNDSSVLTLAETGVYTGGVDIVEYLFSVRKSSSSLSNICSVSLERDSVPDQQTSFAVTDNTNPFLRCLSLSLQIRDTAFISVNEATEGYCDISTAMMSQGEINRNLISEEFIEAPEAQCVQGERLRVVYEPDLKSITVVQQDMYFPPAFWGIMITEQINSTKYTMEICETLETLCPLSWERDGFTSRCECVARMSALPITTVNERGLVTMDTNSTGCRSFHTNLARERQDINCPHISYFPEEDMHGKIKCSENNNRSPQDFFTEGNLALFPRAASSFGLNSSTQFRSSASDNGFGTADDLGECRDSLGLDQNALVGSRPCQTRTLCAVFGIAQGHGRTRHTVLADTHGHVCRRAGVGIVYDGPEVGLVD